MRRAATLLLAVAAACGGSASPPAAEPGTSGAPTSSADSTTSTSTLVAASGECGLEGSYPAAWPERPRYRARLEADPDARTVSGEVAVTFTPPEATDRLVFRLWANGPRAGGAGGRLDVASASIDGEPVTGEYARGNGHPSTPGTIYTLRRSDGFAAGRAVDIELAFTLVMPGPVNERVSQVGSTMRLGSALPTLSYLRGEGWHESPAVGNFSESAASEVADYDVTVEAPEGFTTLATGLEVEPGRFVATAVRDWAATVGRLRVVEGTAQGGRTRVVVGAPEGDGGDIERRLALVIRAVDDMASRWGPLPDPVLTVAVSGTLSGGIEFPWHFQLGTGAGDDSLVHEVAHMWFYALVGSDQYGDPWLDEGLAEYGENRFLGLIGTMRGIGVPSYGAGRLGEGHDYWSRNTSAFYRSVYVQGGQALTAYADEIGGLDALDCALRRYVLDHAYGFVRPDDLFSSLEAQTGVDPRPVFARFGAT